MSTKILPYQWTGLNIRIFLIFVLVLVVTVATYQQQQQQTAMAHGDGTEKSSAIAPPPPPVEKSMFSPIMVEQANMNKDEHQSIDPAKFADAECVIEVKKIEYVPGKCVRLWGTGSTKKNACASYHGGFMEPFSPDCK